MEEQLLVKKAKHGDTEAFAQLYEQIYKRLYQFAFYTLKNTQDAEDVVSDTVTDAFATIRKLRKDEAFSSWMFGILANKCKRKMRDYYVQRQQVEAEQLDNLMPPEGISHREWGSEREEQMDVRMTFFDLEAVDRMIVGMHLFLGYKTREIAQLLEMNENTVRSRESRAIQKMGSRLLGLR